VRDKHLQGCRSAPNPDHHRHAHSGQQFGAD
jgi:hypothetical protein